MSTQDGEDDHPLYRAGIIPEVEHIAQVSIGAEAHILKHLAVLVSIGEHEQLGHTLFIGGLCCEVGGVFGECCAHSGELDGAEAQVGAVALRYAAQGAYRRCVVCVHGRCVSYGVWCGVVWWSQASR